MPASDAHIPIDKSQVPDTSLVSKEPTEEDVQKNEPKKDIDRLKEKGIRFFNKT